jgi:hypothetical protein
VYESAQKIGKYKTIPRTEGVSTTEIVGRMLLMQKTHLDLASVDSEYAPLTSPCDFVVQKQKHTRASAVAILRSEGGYRVYLVPYLSVRLHYCIRMGFTVPGQCSLTAVLAFEIQAKPRPAGDGPEPRPDRQQGLSAQVQLPHHQPHAASILRRYGPLSVNGCRNKRCVGTRSSA